MIFDSIIIATCSVAAYYVIKKTVVNMRQQFNELASDDDDDDDDEGVTVVMVTVECEKDVFYFYNFPDSTFLAKGKQLNEVYEKIRGFYNEDIIIAEIAKV